MAVKDYNAIARAKISKPSQRSAQRKPRILIYSRNKKGKTRFSASAPNVLVLDPEHGTDEERKIDPDTWPIDKWEDMDDAYKFLRTGKHEYEWVAIDGLTRIANMSLRWVMHQAEERDLDRRPGQVGKQDYGKSGEAVKAMLYNFHNLTQMGVIFTAQERMIEGADTGDDDEDAESSALTFVPDLPKGVRGAVNSIVDVIGRLYTVKAEVNVRVPGQEKPQKREVIQRRLWIEPHVSYDTGYRSEHTLPPYLKNPTVEKLERLLKTGKAL